jgi:hypothetical protein
LLHVGPAPARISPAVFGTRRPRQHRFLFDTNEPFSRILNFATNTKQSTSLFLFDTNEQSRITTHHLPITDHGLLIGTPKLLETELTCSQQKRKHFLIGTICSTITPASRSDLLIAGEKILKTALTPSAPIPNVFLIAGACALFSVRAASAHAPRFSALSSAAGCSSHFGPHFSRATDRGSHTAGCGLLITTHQTLITTHQPGAQILHG